MKSSQLATIYVGPQKEVFYLNLDLICDRLDFFKKALQGGFKEGQDKTIHLEVTYSILNPGVDLY